MSEFHAGLPAREAHTQLRRALAELRQAEQNAVLCFSEIMRRRLYRELGFSSIHVYACAALGFSRSKTYEFIRLAEKLECLPELRRSMQAGEIPWTKAREVVKVASPDSERRWLQEARHSSRRELERKVRASRACVKSARKTDRRQASLLDPSPKRELRRDQDSSADNSIETARTVEEPEADESWPLTLNLNVEQRARLDAMVEKIRKLSPSTPMRRASREELVLQALACLLDIQRGMKSERMLPGGDGVGGEHSSTRVDSSSPYQIVVYKCEICGRGSIQGVGGRRGLSSSELGRIECDARVLRPGERSRATVPPAMRRAVLARDEHRCQARGCGNTRFLEVHHLLPHARGGSNRPENLVTLCSACHRLLHERGLAGGAVRLLARGDP